MPGKNHGANSSILEAPLLGHAEITKTKTVKQVEAFKAEELKVIGEERATSSKSLAPVYNFQASVFKVCKEQKGYRKPNEKEVSGERSMW